jgi:adenylate cyclase class 2
MHEIETKVLEVNLLEVSQKIESLGAEKIQEVLLKVDWFSFPENSIDKQPWFLRIRSYSTGKVEVTWKGDLEVLGTSRKVREINLNVEEHEKMKLLFESIGLVVYAHQEKKRISWKLGDVQFDLDTYPNMPSYLEIEGPSEEKINETIKKLNLSEQQTWNDGERTLIEGKYKLDWSKMYF